MAILLASSPPVQPVLGRGLPGDLAQRAGHHVVSGTHGTAGTLGHRVLSTGVWIPFIFFIVLLKAKQ